MTLLIPLGLLALLSIAVLIIIYIIKPNYQQKFISSTYVWKLSLNYRKKRLPTSKLRNILLILCQILALTAIAMIIARPALVLKTDPTAYEVIAIIDSSASMRAKSEEETRYERAVNGVKQLTEEVFSRGGVMTVILANQKPTFFVQRAEENKRTEILSRLDELLEEDLACSYGVADLESAVKLSEDVLMLNPNAEVKLFTDKQFYSKPDDVQVVSCALDGETNSAVLDARVELVDNAYYAIHVDVASYGQDTEINLVVQVYGVNEGISMVPPFSCSALCRQDKTTTVVFTVNDADHELIEAENVQYSIIDQKIYSFNYIHITISDEDAFAEDNTFEVYGGTDEPIKIQYASSDPEIFTNGSLDVLRGYYHKKSLWDLQITEVNTEQKDPEISGYDFYIFEHYTPSELPQDGVVFLFNPMQTIPNSGFTVDAEQTYEYDVFLSEVATHPILTKLRTDSITVRQYQKMTVMDSSFQTLLACDGYPTLMLKDEGNSKIVVAAFSIHISSISMGWEYTFLLRNMIDYFFPATVNGTAFEVGETLTLNARGEELNVSGGNVDETFVEFPSKLQLAVPGTYTLSQTTAFGKTVDEQIFVKVPTEESNICAMGERLPDPYSARDDKDYFSDLLLWFAVALVALLFAEWFLHSRENA